MRNSGVLPVRVIQLRSTGYYRVWCCGKYGWREVRRRGMFPALTGTAGLSKHCILPLRASHPVLLRISWAKRHASYMFTPTPSAPGVPIVAVTMSWCSHGDSSGRTTIQQHTEWYHKVISDRSSRAVGGRSAPKVCRTCQSPRSYQMT